MGRALDAGAGAGGFGGVGGGRGLCGEPVLLPMSCVSRFSLGPCPGPCPGHIHACMSACPVTPRHGWATG